MIPVVAAGPEPDIEGRAVAHGAPHLRRERSDDAPFRLQLFRETHGGILAGLDPRLVEVLLRQQMAGQTISIAARYPDADHDIVECDGVAVGRMVTDWTKTVITLVDVALLAAWRGRGLGSELLGALLRKADAAALPVQLSVAPDNKALHLYVRLGFAAISADMTHITMRRSPAGIGG